MEEQKIREITEDSLKEHKNLFLVDLNVKRNAESQKIMIFVDGEKGISIDQCSKINRQIAVAMEEGDFMQGKYTLEVSSPGLDFPLTMHRQYIKNIGRELTVETIEGEKIEGELMLVNDEMIELKIRGKKQGSLLFKKIRQSKVKISFK